MTTSVPGSNYAFPNIKFNESTIGPVPFTPEWRNTIGLAGVFNKGPQGPIQINSRQQFNALFSEDDSAGSIFVRQAMLQGATNFSISRVMPSARSAVGTVSLQSGTNPTINEAHVSPSGPKTIGLTLNINYVGSPVIRPGVYIGSPVRINSISQFLPVFEGIGYFDATIQEKIVLASITPSAAVTLSFIDIAASGISLVSISSSIDAAGTAIVRSNVKPGLVITKDVADASTTALPVGGLQILSYPYESATGVYSFYVKGTITGAVTATPTSVVVGAPTGTDYYILRYQYRTPSGSLLPSTTISTNTYDVVGSAQGFFTVGNLVKTFQDIKFLNNAAGVITEVNTGIQVALGDTNNSDPMELIPGSVFTVPFIKTSVSIGETDANAPGFPVTSKAFIGGTSSSDILTNLRLEMLKNEFVMGLLDGVDLNISLVPNSVSFTTNFKSIEANRVYYKLTRTVSSDSPQDILFGASGAVYDTNLPMSGGRDGMKSASRFLYDANGNALVYIESLSPGVSGNNIRVTVRPAPPGKFRIDVRDDAAINNAVVNPPETFLLSNYTVDKETGLYGETADSKLIRAYFVPVYENLVSEIATSTFDLTPQRVAPPLSALENSIQINNPLHPAHRGVAYLTGIYLQNGYEPVDYKVTAPSDNDYVDAIRRLETEDVAILCAASLNVGDVRYERAITELLVQAEQSTTFNGLRVSVVATSPNLSASRSETVTAGISSDRLVVVSGFTRMAGVRSVSTSPDGFYAGILASIPPHVSPAAVYAGKSINGVLRTDTKNDPSYLNSLTLSRIEVLHFDNGMQLYKFLNGLTTSSDPTTKWVAIRRLADQIIMDLYRNLQWVRSLPHDAGLRSRVASAIDAYLRTLMRGGQIYTYQPTICDESNNTIDDISRGYLNVRVTYTPVFPADFINVDLLRDITSEFSLTTSVGR